MRRNGFYVCRMMGLAAFAAVCVLATGSRTAFAQGIDNLFELGYFSNAHTSGAPDGTLRLINDGNVSDVSPTGDLCASIYVFDATEQLIECCSCRVTPNGLLTLSVNSNLTGNTLTKTVAPRGVVKVLSSATNNSGICDPTGIFLNVGIRGWITQPQLLSPGKFAFVQSDLHDSNLGQNELADLSEDCKVAIELGSGQGVCSCTEANR